MYVVIETHVLYDLSYGKKATDITCKNIRFIWNKTFIHWIQCCTLKVHIDIDKYKPLCDHNVEIYFNSITQSTEGYEIRSRPIHTHVR